MQTHKLGKEASLEDSISSMQAKLSNIGFTIVEQSWFNPVANVWSVQILDKDCPLLSTNGKGSSKKTALENALGEFLKNLSTHYFWAGYYLGGDIANSKFVHYANEKWYEPPENGDWSKAVLNTELQEFYNPDNELKINQLIDANSANQNRGICCLPFVNQRTQETVYFPVNIIDNLYVSNGTSAANTKVEARVDALSEIIERFIQFKIIAEGVSLPEVPHGVIDRYPSIQTNKKELENASFSLLIKDASLGGKFPVVAITLINPENQGVYLSFGAHPKFEVALERAFIKLLQGKNLDALDKFSEIGFDQDEIASPQNLAKHFNNSCGIISWRFFHKEPDNEYSDWDQQNKNTDTIKELNDLCELIHSQGNDIFIADCEELGVNCCRIIVPGMSEIFPVDDLVWENNNVGIHIRDAILNKNKSKQDCEQLINELETLNLNDEYLVSKLLGLAADKDSIFVDLRVAELITLLALKVQDNERIQEGCEWLIHFKQINPKRLKIYQCINTLLQLDRMVNYGEALEKLYGHEILNDALALIDGEDIFPLRSDWKMHKLLVDAYKKVIKHSKKTPPDF